MYWLLLLLLPFGPLLACAIPLQRRQGGVNPLSSAQVDAFTPLAHFAAAAYCSPSLTSNWKCGGNCQAESDFIPTTAGGDGSGVQFFYVGFSPSLKSVVVAHQGTDPAKIVPLATDAGAVLDNLDPNLFPGIDPSIKAHKGFAGAHAKTANDILAAVKKTLADNKVNAITVVGHSLGAALALLDGAFLSRQIPGVSITMIGYGMPRVGNQAFADFVDANLQVTHISNKRDPVPTVPGQFLGFHHPSREVHINEAGAFNLCEGQENTSNQCSRGDVSNIFKGKLGDHDGPYNGITMGGCN